MSYNLTLFGFILLWLGLLFIGGPLLSYLRRLQYYLVECANLLVLRKQEWELLESRVVVLEKLNDGVARG